MCMIVYRPVNLKGRGANISGRIIETALHRHPDGFGVAYRDTGEDGLPVLVTRKYGPGEGKRFRKELKRIDRTHAGEYVAHFRFATHGAKDAEHAHPYEYNDPELGRVLVFHNGVISAVTTFDDESDTEVFVRDTLAKLGGRWWANPAIRELVTEYIGWSKLVIMTAYETVNMHPARGEWLNGIWYSSEPRDTTSTVRYTGTRAMVPYSSTYGAYQSGGRKSASERITHITPVTAHVTAGHYQYRHAGHNLSPLVDIDRTKDGDYMDAVVCETCYTSGDVYVIDGRVYIDMAHKTGVPRDDDEDAALDAAIDRRIECAMGEFEGEWE